MEEELIESSSDGITTLTLNRPAARNALTGKMLAQMHGALMRAAASRDVRTVVIAASGDAFCAGGDMGNFSQQPGAPEAEERSSKERLTGFDIEGIAYKLRQTCAVTQLLHEMPKPTLAVMPGVAAGAGFSLALACDLRIGSENTRFLTSFSRLGLSGDLGGSYFLTKLVGAAKAREIYFFSNSLGAEEARSLGLLNQVYPAAGLGAAAQAYANQLASLPTIAIGYIKKNLNAALSVPLTQLLDLETEHMVRTMMTSDHREGLRAFLDKRQPTFKGQ